jgi:hypothetical protein
MHRVMSVMETGEEMCAFEGSEYQCFRWIQENAEQYPECRLYSEPICPPLVEEEDELEDDVK